MTAVLNMRNRKADKFLIILLASALILLISPPAAAEENGEELTLSESLEIALEENRGLKSSRAELRGTETLVDMAEAARYPNISISTGYTRMGGDDEMDFDIDEEEDQDPPQLPDLEDIEIEDIEEYIDYITGEFARETSQVMQEEMAAAFEQPDSIHHTEISLQQPLYTFGRISGGIEQAESAYEAGRAGFEDDRQELTHEVITTYHDVILAREMVSVQEDLQRQLEGHKETVEANLDAGTVTELDLHEAEVALSEVEQELLEARTALKTARDGFKILLGLDQRAEVRLTPGDEQMLQDLEKKALELARGDQELDLADNPTLEQLDHQLEASRTGVDVAEAERYPTIALAGSYSWEDEDFGFENSSWSVSLNVSMDIFDGGQRRAEIEQADAELEQLKYSQEELEDSLRMEARRSLNALSDALSRQELAEEMRTEAEKRVELAELRYEEGVGVSTDVLDARTEKTQARVAGREADFARIEAIADLYLALGEMDKLFEEVSRGL